MTIVLEIEMSVSNKLKLLDDRAKCHLRLEKYQEALEDCQRYFFVLSESKCFSFRCGLLSYSADPSPGASKIGSTGGSA